MCPVLLAVLGIGLSVSALAQDVSRLYGPVELQRSAYRYGPNLRGLWEEDLLARLTREERARAGAVTLNLPLVGANRHPLDFYADPSRRQVFLPIASIKFQDDLVVAFAYYESKGCDQGTVADYVAALRFRPDAANGSPLAALGVPAEAIKDPFVDDVAQKMLKATVFFVAAHEYAHVMYGHKAYDDLTAADAQRQEERADAFALDVMRRIGAPPIALAHFFLVASRLEPSPAEFATVSEYETYLRGRATHPVSALRILKVAENIERNPSAFARLHPDVAARASPTLVSDLKKLAYTLDDRNMRRFLAARASGADMAAFRRGCQR